MKLFEELRQDLAVPPAGARAPYYFRYLGYMQDPAAPITTARGNALFSLFTKTTPHVHPHELITGYDYSLWCEADEPPYSMPMRSTVSMAIARSEQTLTTSLRIMSTRLLSVSPDF